MRNIRRRIVFYWNFLDYDFQFLSFIILAQLVLTFDETESLSQRRRPSQAILVPDWWIPTFQEVWIRCGLLFFHVGGGGFCPCMFRRMHRHVFFWLLSLETWHTKASSPRFDECQWNLYRVRRLLLLYFLLFFLFYLFNILFLLHPVRNGHAFRGTGIKCLRKRIDL